VLRTLPIGAVAASAFAALTAAPAAAQANRTFVSGSGSDSNPCSFSAPCRSFAGALAQTNPGGEIAVLDAAGYGQVTITKAVSIVNDGVGEAGVTVTSGDGITVAAGVNDVVNLRGLTLVGGGAGSNGVTFTGGAALNIDHCVIRGFAATGITMLTTVAANLVVTDTTVSNNVSGISVTPHSSSGNTIVTLSRVHASANTNTGIFISPDVEAPVISATVADSLLDSNGIGIKVTANVGTVVMLVDTSKLVQNQTNAVNLSGGGSTLVLGRSTLSGPEGQILRIVSAGAQLLTYGNNQLLRGITPSAF
jgi:hypothetical protein